MSRSARVAAQAKINLLLRVLAREASGYHAIETIFLRLGLADEVVVRVGDDVHGRALDCGGDALPPEGLGETTANLAYRAACASADATGWPTAFAIELTKHIPVGGGLGGGSADAGAVLRALDALAPTPLGEGGLSPLGAHAGADVAFLASAAAAAMGSGRGERLNVVEPLPPKDVVVVVP